MLEAGGQNEKFRGDPYPRSKCVNTADKGLKGGIVVKAVDKGLTAALAALAALVRVNTKKSTINFMICQY
jgi:hypothetical protein